MLISGSDQTDTQAKRPSKEQNREMLSLLGKILHSPASDKTLTDNQAENQAGQATSGPQSSPPAIDCEPKQSGSGSSALPIPSPPPLTAAFRTPLPRLTRQARRNNEAVYGNVRLADMEVLISKREFHNMKHHALHEWLGRKLPHVKHAKAEPKKIPDQGEKGARKTERKKKRPTSGNQSIEWSGGVMPTTSARGATEGGDRHHGHLTRSQAMNLLPPGCRIADVEVLVRDASFATRCRKARKKAAKVVYPEKKASRRKS